MYPRAILLVLAMIFTSASYAQGIRIQLGNQSARFTYLTEAFGQDFGRLELEAGFMYTEQDDYLVNVGLLVRGESISVPLIVAIGARAYYANVEPYTLGAIAIGADLLLSPESWGGLGLGGYFYKAPGVVSYSDAEGLTEYGLYLSYQITPQAKIALGYQNIEADTTLVNNLEIDKSGYFAVHIEF